MRPPSGDNTVSVCYWNSEHACLVTSLYVQFQFEIATRRAGFVRGSPGHLEEGIFPSRGGAGGGADAEDQSAGSQYIIGIDQLIRSAGRRVGPGACRYVRKAASVHIALGKPLRGTRGGCLVASLARVGQKKPVQFLVVLENRSFSVCCFADRSRHDQKSSTPTEGSKANIPRIDYAQPGQPSLLTHHWKLIRLHRSSS